MSDPLSDGMTDPRPGDFVLTHRDALTSRVIAFGQRLRRLPADARWTHAALIGHGELIEALGSGVQFSPLDKYRGVEHEIVQTGMTFHDRMQAVAFAESCVGWPYGWTTIASLGLTLATGGRFGFEREGTLICSALVAQSLSRGPMIFTRDPARMMPADLALAYDRHGAA